MVYKMKNERYLTIALGKGRLAKTTLKLFEKLELHVKKLMIRIQEN